MGGGKSLIRRIWDTMEQNSGSWRETNRETGLSKGSSLAERRSG